MRGERCDIYCHRYERPVSQIFYDNCKTCCYGDWSIAACSGCIREDRCKDETKAGKAVMVREENDG